MIMEKRNITMQIKEMANFIMYVLYRYEPFISSLCLKQKGKHIGCPSAEDTRGGC
jgi:hypothetical protein